MSTDVPRQKQAKQNKSMFILLSILTLLVISTLVVASVYFLKPRVDRLKNMPQQVHKPSPTMSASSSKKLISKTTQPKVADTVNDDEVENKSDNCDVRFTDNALFVKNSER